MAQHIATAAVVKVSIGSPSGNRVATFVQRGGVIPEGVAEDQLNRLIDRGLITSVTVEEPDAGETTVPDGDPSEEWSGKQLDKFAAELGIDLGGSRTKSDKVAALAAATKK